MKLKDKIRENMKRRKRKRWETQEIMSGVLTHQRKVEHGYKKNSFTYIGEREEVIHGRTTGKAKLYQDETFACAVYEPDKDGYTLITVQRRDAGHIRDWRDMQRIKNELLGPEREAVELYPAESRLVDTRNTYHLWAVPEGRGFSFGFWQGRKVA